MTGQVYVLTVLSIFSNCTSTSQIQNICYI